MNAPMRVLLPSTAAALPLGIVLGWAAHWVEQRFAPVGLFSLLVGVVVGGASFGVGKLLGRTGRVTLWLSTTVAALACCGTLHWAGYRTAVRAAEADVETHRRMLQAFPQKGFLPPPPGIGSFGDFLAREWDVGRKLGPKSIRHGWLGLWWALDGLALLVGALSTALFCGERSRNPSQIVESILNAMDAPEAADEPDEPTGPKPSETAP